MYIASHFIFQLSIPYNYSGYKTVPYRVLFMSAINRSDNWPAIVSDVIATIFTSKLWGKSNWLYLAMLSHNRNVKNKEQTRNIFMTIRKYYGYSLNHIG